MKTNFSQKSKVNSIKLLSLLISIMIVAVIQSCQKENDLSIDETLFNSDEFINFVDSGIEYYGSIIEYAVGYKTFENLGLQDTTIKYGSAKLTFGVYRGKAYQVGQKRKTFQDKYNILVQRYPEYSSLNQKELKIHIEDLFTKDRLKEILLKYSKYFNTSDLKFSRGSKDDPEGEIYYSSSEDAFSYAISYSNSTWLEVGGLVFADGSAMIYYYSGATHHSTNLCQGPVTIINGISYYYGLEVASTFHTHFNSGDISIADANAQGGAFPNADLIILWNWDMWLIHFVNGIPQQVTY